MSPRPRSAVRRLVSAVRLFGRRRETRAEFARLLDQLLGASLLAVAGEMDLLVAVDARLQEAEQAIHRLERETSVDSALAGLEASLGGYEWEVLDAVLPALQGKLTLQNEVIQGLQADVDGWRSRLGPLLLAIDEGLAARAPVARERAAADRLTGLVTAAERALSDRRYTDVNDPLRRLSGTADTPEVLADRVRAKIIAAQRFGGRAEVLLLHTAAAKGLHAYTVLLRTPSEAGTQGFSIQDSSVLVDQDRAYIRKGIDLITRAVDLGIARVFQPPVDGDGPVRDARPGLSTQSSPTATPEDLPTLIGEVGEVMFRLIAPDRMRHYISTSPCSLTITTDDLELPWELMYDESLEETPAEKGQGFLCLQRPIARMPMGRAFPRLRRVTRQKAKLRFLLIYADPHDNLKAAEEEIDKIERALRAAPDAAEDIEVTPLKKDKVTGEELNRALLTGRYDVIHFAGHAGFDDDDPDLSGLLLHDGERFLSQKIQRFVEGRPLVFLNACETGRAANAAAPQSVGEYFWKPAEGLASAFLYGGALGCVGSLWPVYDDPAAEFAIEFYHHALEGHMLGEAMRLARRTIRERYPESITWASFVLYGDPTYRLVR